jgi:hypothetical protein
MEILACSCDGVSLKDKSAIVPAFSAVIFKPSAAE